MDMSEEELSPIEEEIIRLEARAEELREEFMSLLPKEKDTLNLNLNREDKIKEKIEKARLKLIKRGIKI